MKRLLYITHRWLGIALGLFMLLWFFSGLVMVYTGSTAIDQRDRLSHAQEIPLQGADTWLSLAEAWQLSERQRGALAREAKTKPAGHAHGTPDTAVDGRLDGIAEARLAVLNDQPVWRVTDPQGRRYALSARSGEVQIISPEAALRVAGQWGGEGTAPRLLETLERDLATRMMALDGYRPFHKVALRDASGTELDISARTGEVVVATTRLQRILAYCGDWLHFLRFLDNMGLGEQRRTVLTWTAFFSTVGVLAGLIVGWLRWRPGWLGGHTYSNGRTQPYREPWARWHFWLGLVGGVLTFTWILSGFLVNNPWEIFSKARFNQQELLRFQGGALPAEVLAISPEALLPKDGQAVEVALRTVGDRHFSFAYDAAGNAQVPAPFAQSNDREQALLKAAQRLVPDTPISAVALLADYDDYYYPNHRRSTTDRPLPVLRVDFADSAGHRLYVDPTEGRPVLGIDNSRRAYRWLFYALHNWDLGVLYRRPVWDVWMVIWSLVGLALSVTSLRIGWRRLKDSTASFRSPIWRLRSNPRRTGA